MSEKIYVLDLVISVLQEHEKNLDALIERFEEAVKRLERRADELETMRKFFEPI